MPFSAKSGARAACAFIMADTLVKRTIVFSSTSGKICASVSFTASLYSGAEGLGKNFATITERFSSLFADSLYTRKNGDFFPPGASMPIFCTK